MSTAEKNLRTPEVLKAEEADFKAFNEQKAKVQKLHLDKMADKLKEVAHVPKFGPCMFAGVYPATTYGADGKAVELEGKVKLKFMSAQGEFMLTADDHLTPILPNGEKPGKEDRFLISFTLTDKNQSVNRYNPNTKESTTAKQTGWLPDELLRWKLLPRETLSFD
ncbi:MAG: hypothetical protein RL095_476 [Verrucomicrobiota bacterium]|jgi:hypothetical protein